MALEAAKTLAFSAGCQLLHFDLLEAREVISLLPRFADAPFSLHLAVLQALIALLVRTDSYERPYLASLSALLLDLLLFLRSAPPSLLPPFTQQTVLSGLLKAVLAPAVQQRQDERSDAARVQLYLPLLAFLT